MNILQDLYYEINLNLQSDYSYLKIIKFVQDPVQLKSWELEYKTSSTLQRRSKIPKTLIKLIATRTDEQSIRASN